MSSDPPEQAPARPRRRLWIVLGTLLALAVVVRVALPYALEWAVGWGAMSQAGLDARVRNIDLGVLAGRIQIDELWVAAPGVAAAEDPAPDPAAALFALEEARVNFEWTRLLSGEINLSELGLRGPRLRLARQADGRIDPLAGATPPPPDPDAEAEEEAEAPPPEEDTAEGEPEPGWLVVVDDLRLGGLGVRIVDEPDAEELLAFDLEGLALHALSLQDGNLGLAGIGISGPSLRIDRGFVLDPTGGRVAEVVEEEEEEEADPDARPPGYRIAELAIDRAAFSLLVGERSVDIALGFDAKDVSMNRGARFPMRLELGVGEGELVLDGNTGLNPPAFAGTLKAQDMPMSLLALGVRPDLGDWLRSAALDLDFELDAWLAEAREGAPPSLLANGTLAIRDLAFGQPGSENLDLAWKQLDVVVADATVPIPTEGIEAARLEVHVERVTLVEPQAAYVQPSDALERLSEGPVQEEAETVAEETAEAEPPEAEPQPEAEPAPPARIRVDLVEIQGGDVRFRDRSVDPEYQGRVRELALKVANVRLPGPSIGQLDLDAKLPGGSRLVAAGQIQPAEGRIDLDLTRLPLPPVNGYASGAGLAITRGSLTLKSDLDAQGTSWTIDNDVTLHDLVIDSEGSKQFLDQIDVSLDMILALLRDPQGDISLPIPLAFEEGEMQTGIGEIIAAAVREALVGAATLPLKAVGVLLGGGGELEVETIPFEPGWEVPTAGLSERVSGLADLLESHPVLEVELVGQAGKGDRDALAARALGDLLEAGGDLPEVGEGKGAGLLARGRIRGALRDIAQRKPVSLSPEDQVFFERYVEAFEVPSDRYAALARGRAEAVQSALLATERVDAARVSVGEGAEGDPGVVFDLRSVSGEP